VAEGYLAVEYDGGPRRIIPLSEMPLPGAHNVTNALAAALAASRCGVSGEQLARGLAEFTPVDHLLQEVAEVRGVRFVDDSKATNTAAALADLATLNGPLLVITGGLGKETDFSRFGERLSERAKFVCLIGESGPAIRAAVGDGTSAVMAPSLAEAVQTCFDRAEPGDTVVLLPGCASFDMFQNQTHRGEEFTRLAREIARREARRGA
jgi:UDP-N-acetylmuramoylalanine--D-glutamate ligase